MLEHDIIEPSDSELNQQKVTTPTVDEMLEKMADIVGQGVVTPMNKSASQPGLP